MKEELYQSGSPDLGTVFLYEKRQDGVVIRRCFSREECVALPEQICGLPVTEAGPYCFSAHMEEKELQKGLQTEAGVLPPLCGNALKELVLPGSIRRMGRYCLYNCDALELLEFVGGLSDWSSGVFTGCHHIKTIRLHLKEDGRSSLKQVLDEVPDAVEAEVYCESGEHGEVLTARLVFPEFYEEGVENTPARILETHVHGSGILYRNCFQNRVLDFQQYDRLFPYAVAREDFEITARIVTDRLWLPHGLTEAARGRYEEYAVSEREQFGQLFIEKRDMRGIRWLTELAGKAHPGLYDLLTDLAGRAGFVEAVSFLMESRRASEKNRPAKRRRRFEL